MVHREDAHNSAISSPASAIKGISLEAEAFEITADVLAHLTESLDQFDCAIVQTTYDKWMADPHFLADNNAFIRRITKHLTTEQTRSLVRQYQILHNLVYWTSGEQT